MQESLWLVVSVLEQRLLIWVVTSKTPHTHVIFRTTTHHIGGVRALHYPWCGYISSFHVAPLIPPPPGFEYSDKRNMSSHVLVPGAVSCRVEYMRRKPFSLSQPHVWDSRWITYIGFLTPSYWILYCPHPPQERFIL